MRQELWLYPSSRSAHPRFRHAGRLDRVLDLRLLGLSRAISVRALARHVLPWTLGALLVIVPTGLLMFMAHAADFVGNRAFILKLTLIFGGGINAAVFHTGPFRSVAQWDRGVATPPAAKLHAAASLDDLGRRDRMRTTAGLPLTPRLGYAAGIPRVRRAARLRALPAVLPGAGPVPAVHPPARRLHRDDGGVPRRGAARARTRAARSSTAGCSSSWPRIGAAIAARHVWLQHLPKDQVPECGPGLEYMLRKYSPFQALEKIFAGSGECAESGWSFLGLTIAGWSLVWFVLLGAFAVYLTLRAPRAAQP